MFVRLSSCAEMASSAGDRENSVVRVANANRHIDELVRVMKVRTGLKLPLVTYIVSHQIQKHLAKECGITVAEVVKAGSLGQGTAISGEFDIDLVLYSRGESKLSIQ